MSANDEVSETSRINRDAITPEFKEHVRRYVEIGDAIKEKQKEIKDLNQRKKESEKFILKQMDLIGVRSFEINGGKLIKNQSETKVAVNNDIIKQAISRKVNDPAILDQILDDMENSRPKKTRVNLKRTSERQRATAV